MRISHLTAYHARIPLKRTIRHASHTRTANDTLLVACTLDDGTVGWGEGLPRPYVTGETIESVFTQLKATDWKSQLGASLACLPDAVALCSKVTLAAAPAEARDCFGNAARCAVELSILDAVARREGVPLSAVTSLVPETSAIRQSVARVRYSGVITSMGRARETFRAWQLRLAGFEQCKAKVGITGVDDRAAVGRIRRALGPRIDLRIDANEAWSCATLESKLAPLLDLDISCVEQPVPHAEVDGLAAIRRRIGIPLMLDESLCSLADGQRAVERGTCDLFNIRLSKCGGMVNSLRLAALAHRAGLGYQLGAQVGETGILSAAGRHFACSVAGIRYLEGSYDRYLVRERLTRQDLTFGWGGLANALNGPGLGVDIDTKVVERLTMRRHDWNLA